MAEYRKLRNEVHKVSDLIGKLNKDLRKLRNRVSIQLYVEGNALNMETIKLNMMFNQLNTKVQKFNPEASHSKEMVQQLRDAVSLIKDRTENLRDQVLTALSSFQIETNKSKSISP